MTVNAGLFAQGGEAPLTPGWYIVSQQPRLRRWWSGTEWVGEAFADTPAAVPAADLTNHEITPGSEGLVGLSRKELRERGQLP